MKNFDYALTSRIHRFAHQSPALDAAGYFIAKIFPFFFAGFGITWLLFQRHTIISFILSIFVGWVFALGFEFLINRKRPYQRTHTKPLAKPITHTPSFPSGHATLSFAGAGALLWIDPMIGLLFCIMAGMIAISRVFLGVHYVSDITAGAVLGITVSFFIHLWMF
jgi:undecaprenyl-diphosphatase